MHANGTLIEDRVNGLDDRMATSLHLGYNGYSSNRRWSCVERRGSSSRLIYCDINGYYNATFILSRFDIRGPSEVYKLSKFCGVTTTPQSQASTVQ